jgi:UPF0176 protein
VKTCSPSQADQGGAKRFSPTWPSKFAHLGPKTLDFKRKLAEVGGDYPGLVFTHDSYYRFAQVDDPAALATSTLAELRRIGAVFGTVLVATEGINVMLCGAAHDLDEAKAWFESQDGFGDLFVKRTMCDDMVFQRLKVKVKREIVPLGLIDVDATKGGGRAVTPTEWCDLLDRDDVIVIDNRNSFEFGHGRFRNAIDPRVDNFRQFADYFDNHLEEWGDRTIAMYCTGGIRCDKTAAWAAERGVEVVTLEGGIINFLQQVNEPEKFWDGTCFVFDNRRELDARLQSVEAGNEA